MRVVTWNIWWRFGPWRERQPGIEAELRRLDADVICLQEVIPGADLRTGEDWSIDGSGRDQATVLADRLGRHVATTFETSSWMGNAVLSRWPISSTEVVSLPSAPERRPNRTAVLAVLDAPFGPVPVVSTHLAYEFDRSAERVEQARALARLVRPHVDRERYPPLLCGDMNARPETDEIRLLTGYSAGIDGVVFQDAWERAGDGPGWTWSGDNPHLAQSKWPDRRLDYVLVSAFRTPPAGTVRAVSLAGTEPHDGVVPSDHYAVVADLDEPAS